MIYARDETLSCSASKILKWLQSIGILRAPNDKARVVAKVLVNEAVSEMTLLASDTVLNNLIWKKLEICHAMKLSGYKVAEGFQVVTVHVIDASMLPMSLQSFAGDCLITKALTIPPMVD